MQIGYGGMDFHVMFDKLDAYFDENPTAIIIITDRYADFPNESTSKEIPIFWIIGDSNVESPWGKCVHIETAAYEADDQYEILRLEGR